MSVLKCDKCGVVGEDVQRRRVGSPRRFFSLDLCPPHRAPIDELIDLGDLLRSSPAVRAAFRPATMKEVREAARQGRRARRSSGPG